MTWRQIRIFRGEIREKIPFAFASFTTTMTGGALLQSHTTMTRGTAAKSTTFFCCWSNCCCVRSLVRRLACCVLRNACCVLRWHKQHGHGGSSIENKGRENNNTWCAALFYWSCRVDMISGSIVVGDCFIQWLSGETSESSWSTCCGDFMFVVVLVIFVRVCVWGWIIPSMVFFSFIRAIWWTCVRLGLNFSVDGFFQLHSCHLIVRNFGPVCVWGWILPSMVFFSFIRAICDACVTCVRLGLNYTVDGFFQLHSCDLRSVISDSVWFCYVCSCHALNQITWGLAICTHHGWVKFNTVRSGKLK